MKPILNPRPVVFVAFFMVVGILFSYYLDIPAPIFWILLAGGAGFFLCAFFLKNRPMLVALYLVFFSIGGLIFQVQFSTDFSHITPGQDYTIEGYVSDRSSMSSAYHSYTLDNVSLTARDGRKENFSKKVLLYSREVLDYGDTVTFETKVSPPGATRNPGGMDEQMYLASRGAGFSCFSEEVRSVSHSPGWYYYPLKLRETLAEKIDQIFSPEMAPVAKAMFLGVKNDLTEEMRDTFSKTGIAHILAVSGLHVAIIAFAFNWLCRKLRIRRSIRFSINIAVLLSYALLTGFAPSIIRAVLMMLFLIIGQWMFKKRDTLTFLAAAMVITLLFNAPQLFTAGFLMSYGVLFGLLCLGPPLTRLLQKIKMDKARLAMPLATSVSATASVFPLSAYYFNNIALAAPVANLFAIPLAGIIVAFTGIGSVLALFALPAGHAVAFPAELCLQALTWLNGMLASTSFGYIEIYRFPIWIGVVVFIIIFFCSDYVLLRNKVKMAVAGLLAALIMCFGISSAIAHSSSLKVVALDVGTGDAIHISVQGKEYLIDNGGNPQYSQINDYAKKNRLVFDGVVITNDRTKNLKELVQAKRVNRLYVPLNYVPKDYDANLEMKYYALYDKIELAGDVYLDVVGDDQKHLSLVLYQDGRPICLLMQNKTDDLLYQEHVPIVKLPNGGEKDAANSRLLKAWSPDYAVISVKEGNRKGLPDRGLLDLLDEMHIDTLATPQTGAVTFTVDREGRISVTTEKK